MESDYRELITKFFAEEISDSELELLKSWIEEKSVNRRIFDQENELWHVSDVKTRIEHFNPDVAWNSISSRYSLVRNRKGRIAIIKKNRIGLLVAAASVVLLILSGSVGLWIKATKSLNQLTNSSTVVTTNFGEKARIFLPDSTEVILNSGSDIRYDAGYNLKERVVRLNGEAYFIVITNPAKPFVVKLDGMSVSAHGTRFNILSYRNENHVETTLEEGELEVSVEGNRSLRLKPGQQVTFSRITNKVDIQNVNAETYLSWIDNKLQLFDTPFEEALRKIARKYNVTFEISNKGLLDLKYTATFIDESIEDVMDNLKIISPISYKIYYRATKNEKEYLKPKIVVGRKKKV